MTYDTKPTEPPSLISVAGWLVRNDWCKEALAVSDAVSRISELEAEVARLRQCCIKQSYEVRQSLAVALYGDLESAGEHVAETLALEAAEKIKRLTAEVTRLTAQPGKE